MSSHLERLPVELQILIYKRVVVAAKPIGIVTKGSPGKGDYSIEISTKDTPRVSNFWIEILEYTHADMYRTASALSHVSRNVRQVSTYQFFRNNRFAFFHPSFLHDFASVVPPDYRRLIQHVTVEWFRLTLEEVDTPGLFSNFTGLQHLRLECDRNDLLGFPIDAAGWKGHWINWLLEGRALQSVKLRFMDKNILEIPGFANWKVVSQEGMTWEPGRRFFQLVDYLHQHNVSPWLVGKVCSGCTKDFVGKREICYLGVTVRRQ